MKWIRRKAHSRTISAGKVTWIAEAWVPQTYERTKKPAKLIVSVCPNCGTTIQSRRMPNGGWGHFENLAGLKDVKHACLNRGEKLSKKRDDETADMFDDTDDDN